MNLKNLFSFQTSLSLIAIVTVVLISCGDKSTGLKNIPPQPSAIQVIGVSDSTVSVHWSSSQAPDYAHYKLFHSTSSSGLLNSVPDSIVVQTDTVITIRNLQPQTHYFFTIVTVTKSLQSAQSNIVDTITDKDLSLHPSTIHILAVSNSTVSIQWSASQAADYASYKVFWSTDTNGLFKASVDSLINRTDTVFTIKSLRSQTRYYFAVATISKSLQSAQSNIVDTVTDIDTSLQPSTINIARVSDSTVTVQWSTSQASGYKFYRLLCSTSKDGLSNSFVDSTVVRTDTVFTIRNLQPQTHYYFAIETHSKSLQTVQSNIIDVATKTTIVFQFRPMPDTLHPVISIVGYTGGLVKTPNATLAGTVVLSESFVEDLKGYRILDTNIKLVKIQPRSRPLPCKREYLDSLFAFIGALKTVDQVVSPLTPWDTIISLNGDSLLPAGVYNRTLIIANCPLTISAGTALTGCAVVSSKNLNIKGNTSNCLLEADSGVVIASGMHSSAIFSHGIININPSAIFSSTNAIVSHRPSNKANVRTGGIIIDSESIVRGTIISYESIDTASTIWDTSITVGGKCRIEGTIVTDHGLKIKNCTVIGHIWCDRIDNADDTEKGYVIGYVNFLWGMTVLPPNPEYQFPILGAPYVKAVDLFQ